MITLGIESTAHTFGIAILKNKKFLCNIKEMYTTKKGGMIPMEVAKHHKKIANTLYKKALKLAKIKEKQINLIAFSNAPGLAPCLLQGRDFAKQLAIKLKISLVPVNHCIAHLEIGELTGAKDPVLLYCSGANTQVIAYAAGKYRVFGETLDMGVGNFIDTFARSAGLGFPAGPKIEELAKKSKNFIQLPYSVKGMDVSFSGLLTNLKQKLEKHKLEDLAFSLQEHAFAMLIEVAERAMAHLNKKELLLGGGVACNKRLQKMAKIMCKERKSKCFVPEKEFLLDNAGMIAYLGKKMFDSGIQIDPKKADINDHQRTDDVEVTWRISEAVGVK
ncbi:MAG: KEOPS complex N(6)-L-threonylcarbamoyladenine synthase Kae1 [archaeon]